MTDRKNRIVSWIILIVCSVCLVCTSVFLITHADHDCTGEDCPICAELAECYHVLHTLGTAAASAAALHLTLFFVSILAKGVIQPRSAHTTLISLKVELLN